MDETKQEQLKALKTAANLLSRRSHSFKELKTKLLSKYSESIVDKTLEEVQKNNWLEDENELAQRTAKNLHQKNKSWFYIKNYLRKKDLPLPEHNNQIEREKGRNLLLKKFGTETFKTYEERQKAKAFLANKGFEQEVIFQIVSE